MRRTAGPFVFFKSFLSTFFVPRAFCSRDFDKISIKILPDVADTVELDLISK